MKDDLWCNIFEFVNMLIVTCVRNQVCISERNVCTKQLGNLNFIESKFCMFINREINGIYYSGQVHLEFETNDGK